MDKLQRICRDVDKNNMVTNEWIPGNQNPSIAYEIRRKVFVEEQHCDPAKEQDCFDGQAMHLVVYTDGAAAAAGRIYHDGVHFKIGRLCVLPEFRGQGIGDLAIRLLLFKAFQFAGEVHIGAQKYLEKFYGKFGFQKYGEDYIEENIPHIYMVLYKEKCVFPSKCKGEEPTNE